MADRQVHTPARGCTFFQGQTVDTNNLPGIHLEGQKTIFKNTNPSNRKLLRDGSDVRAILVRNSSGITLRAKAVVKWAAGYMERRVDGYCNVDYEAVAGIVDDHIGSNGVPNGDLFWLIVEGQCLGKTPIDQFTSIVEGDNLLALTAAASTGTTAGRFQKFTTPFTATQTTDGTALKVANNRFAKAMSAKTTANTDTDILLNVKLF